MANVQFELSGWEESAGRRGADHHMLEPGDYCFDGLSFEGAYMPDDRSGWLHELHVAILPVQQSYAAPMQPPEPEHRILRNRADPGPHANPRAARDAFLAMPAAERTIRLAVRSHVVAWLQGIDAYESDGRMHVRLTRLDAAG